MADIDVIWGNREAEYFYERDWTTQITLIVLAYFLSRRAPDIFGERAV